MAGKIGKTVSERDRAWKEAKRNLWRDKGRDVRRESGQMRKHKVGQALDGNENSKVN